MTVNTNPPRLPRDQLGHVAGGYHSALTVLAKTANVTIRPLGTGSITDANQLAKRERCTVRQVNLTLSLAFLAPQLVKAAVEGRLPRGINIERLRDPDAEWGRQFEELGASIRTRSQAFDL